MERMRNALCFVLIVMIIAGLTGCQYKRQVVPLKMPAAYPNATDFAGATIAAKAYEDDSEASSAFGFDIRQAGLLPVQVVFDNKGGHSLEIVPNQTFLIDGDNNLWPVLESNLAYDRVAKKTELGKVAPQAAKYGTLAGIAGGMIGAAIGIVTGRNVGELALKGAAVGAATGAVAGGAAGLSNSDVKGAIREDLQKRTLENKPIKPQEIAHGFIFFPGEAGKAKELRLGLREKETNEFRSLIMKLE
jgi:hypothetical protein